MRKIRLLVLTLLVGLSLQGSAIAAGQASVVNTDKANEGGVVTVSYKSDSATKIMVKKGDEKYTYDLKGSNSFPLQLGNGEYEISVLENISGNRYRVVHKENVTLNMKDSKSVYLQSIQLVNWDQDMNAIRKAAELTKGLKSDSAKVAAVHNYVINTLSYDYSKIGKLSSDYVPAVEKVFSSSKGICYDYSVLTAAMLRSIGIPAKLVMGYKNDIETYHAWNQVYLKDSNEWVTIDTTYDSILKAAKKEVKMEKASSQYKADKQY